jgi:Lipase 3 N-terminal region
MKDFLSLVSFGLLAFPSVTSAIAVEPLVERDVLRVNQTTFQVLSLFEQFSAAAYCPGNWGGPVGTKITCIGSATPQSNCPDIEGDNTNIVLKFAK